MKSAKTPPVAQTPDKQEPAKRATNQPHPTKVGDTEDHKHLPSGMAEQMETVEVSTGKPHVPGTRKKQ